MREKGSKPVVIEATSKRWKVIQAVGVILAVIGGATCGISSGMGSEETASTGIDVALAGFAVLIAGRVGAWWQHG